MSQDFWLGFAVGLFVCGVIAWFMFTIHKYYRDANAFNKPQLLIQPTAKTPAQVYRDAVSAQTRIGCLRFLLVLYVIGVAAALSRDVREWLLLLVANALNFFQ